MGTFNFKLTILIKLNLRPTKHIGFHLHGSTNSFNCFTLFASSVPNENDRIDEYFSTYNSKYK